ncbi:MAG: hypothetical protein WD595_04245 [Waddliaceae bacterium]
MDDQSKKAHMSIVEAVETLGAIADLDPRQLSGAPENELPTPLKSQKNMMYWLKGESPEKRMKRVRETFKDILNYLQRFYENDYTRLQDRKVIDEIKSIMVLVGESAKNLDQLSDERTITKCNEYKELQRFYKKRVATQISEGKLGKWILALTKRLRKIGSQNVLSDRPIQDTTQIFVDLEGVKSDHDYELFYIRKENGEHYYSPRVLRNMKLVSDFEGYFGYRRSEDPLIEVDHWKDFYALQVAKEIGRISEVETEEFCKLEMEMRDTDLRQVINSCLIALRMSAKEGNLLSRTTGKNCIEYFNDFLFYLRKSLHTTGYSQLINSPSNKMNPSSKAAIELLHVICWALYENRGGYSKLLPAIQETVESAHEGLTLDQDSEKLAWEQIAGDYEVMKRLIKNHPSGSLNKVLDSLEGGNHISFDPLHQENLPTFFYNLPVGKETVLVSRCPSPTCQDYIQKASIIEEYRAFLRHQANRQCLVFNYQDRAHWKEYSRCEALEKLAKEKEFREKLTVVTLTKDSEFYHQQGVYAEENYVEVFLELFKEQLSDNNTGYYIPKSIRKQLFPKFTQEAFKKIHQIFFSEKNVLTIKERQTFIEIFYVLFQCKLIELLKPSQISMVCKDGIDATCPSLVQLYAFKEMLLCGGLVQNDFDQISLMIYGPALMVRERVIHYDRFYRMLGVIKQIETVASEMGIAEFKSRLLKEFPFLQVISERQSR